MSELDGTLRAAAQALRATADAGGHAPATRGRILTTLSTRRRRSRSLRTFALVAAVALALPLISPSARAQLGVAWRGVVARVASLTTEEPPRAPAPARKARSDRPIAPVPRLATPEIASPAPPRTEPAVVAPAPDPPDASLALDALYRAAHDAHFGARDPARALALWNKYIARAPRGRFTLEARYNRGLALVRLGRWDEARHALAPFAEGRHGGYRRSEAAALLQALPAEADEQR